LDYTIVLEGSSKEGFSAYSPDVPGVFATGKTESVVRKRIASGIRFHFEMLRRSGEPIPVPTTTTYKQSIEIQPLKPPSSQKRTPARRKS
jgi:predicted RNase H-like HicB family nuclease